MAVALVALGMSTPRSPTDDKRCRSSSGRPTWPFPSDPRFLKGRRRRVNRRHGIGNLVGGQQKGKASRRSRRLSEFRTVHLGQVDEESLGVQPANYNGSLVFQRDHTARCMQLQPGKRDLSATLPILGSCKMYRNSWQTTCCTSKRSRRSTSQVTTGLSGVALMLYGRDLALPVGTLDSLICEASLPRIYMCFVSSPRTRPLSICAVSEVLADHTRIAIYRL